MRQVLILGVEDNRTSVAVGHRRLQSVPFCLLHEALTIASESFKNVRMDASRQLVRDDSW